jgi:5S rRNA maturation endonuclease (ribonuclease M5)
MDKMNNFEKLERLLTELKEDQRIKVVEGRKDYDALSYFGIKNIEMLNGRPLQEIASLGKDVILLMDYDRKGEELTRRLAELFRNESAKTDLSYRKELGRITGIKKIEELVKKYEELEGDNNGKNLCGYRKICNLRTCRDGRHH